MHTLARFFALTTTLSLVTACDPEVDGLVPDGEIAFRCNPAFNTCGLPTNTPHIGALEISALDTLGDVYKDVAVDDVVLPGNVVLDGFSAADGQLRGFKGAVEYQGMDFQGAEFKLTVAGEPLSLLVSAVTPPPAGESLWLYRFDADEDGPGGDEAAPVCEFTGAEVRAVVHDDLDIDPETGEVSARPDTVYIACLGGAAGKVAYAPLGFGFRPFEVGLAGFEAAMRFIRADYCGDGTPWTESGQPLSYEDKWGVGAGVELGHTDAVWGMHGALCLGEELRAGFTYDDIECPSGVKPPRCTDVAAEALYLAHGQIWSALP